VSAFWHIDPRPDGRPAPGGPPVEAVEDKFELVAAGQAVTITVQAHARTLRRPHHRPRTGVEPSHVVLAVRTGEPNGLVAAFRTYARAHLTGTS
jgi:hypothetical protein